MSNDEQPTTTTGRVDLDLSEDGALEVTGDTPWAGRWVRAQLTQDIEKRIVIAAFRRHAATCLETARKHPEASLIWQNYANELRQTADEVESGLTDVAPSGWDRIEAGTENDQDDIHDPGADADRALERMELDNDRARIDLEREKLAHARLVASDELRIHALQTAKSVAAEHKYMTATDRAEGIASYYRMFIGLLEEPDPANGPQPSGDGRIDRSPGDVRLYDHVEQRPV